MKKYILILAPLFLLLVFLCISCKKEEETIAPTVSSGNITVSPAQLPEDDALADTADAAVLDDALADTANTAVLDESLTDTANTAVLDDTLADAADTAVLDDALSNNADIDIENGTSSNTLETESEDAMHKEETFSNSADTNRVTYKPDFYYEDITDSIKSRIYGISYKEDCTVPYEELRYVSVLYMDFDWNTQCGELICNKEIAQDLVEIFYELYEAEYKIEQIRLIDKYLADDTLSMEDNNTSCFNYRVVDGSENLSKHALGLALDINPFYNPCVTYPDGVQRVSPEKSEFYADRNKEFDYKIDKNDLCYQLFTEHGFTWGGDWKSLKDYQHFQKDLS